VPEAYVSSGRYIPTAPLFFEGLKRAELPEAVRAPIGGVLEIFLEDDEETIAPSQASFTAFLHFLKWHRDLPLPSIGVNRDGMFVAVWQSSAYRLSYEFLSNGNVFWAETKEQPGRIVVRDGVADLDAIPSDFACLRGIPGAPA